MARKRDYAAEYAARKARSIEKGYSSPYKEYQEKVSEPYEYDSREHGSSDWDSFGNHHDKNWGGEGSHWHWELGQNQDAKGQSGTRFSTLKEANTIARDIKAHQGEYIKQDTNSEVGQIGYIRVFEDDDGWGIELDAYIEY